MSIANRSWRSCIDAAGADRFCRPFESALSGIVVALRAGPGSGGFPIVSGAGECVEWGFDRDPACFDCNPACPVVPEPDAVEQYNGWLTE